MLVLTCNKVAYFPITKNASTTFTDHFEGIGWERGQFDLLDESYEIFAHFRDPIERHFKGTAEFLLQNKIEHLADDPLWQKIWTRSVMDLHSYPVTWTVGNRLINWILIKSGVDTIDLTRQWLATRNIDLGQVKYKHRSSQSELALYQKLKDLYETLDEKSRTLTYFYETDILLWNRLCANHWTNK